ncbi:hypothetical protein ACTU3I_06560 [Microbacterium sp. RD1]|uniref:hypothetical protein n=1 Tax=Microbacterium sp. RD1 TaxID=3457313 RepID=UPI003FA5F60C
MDERDLPEGVIDADPAGGWESGSTADGETAEQSADAAGSPALTDDGSPANVEGAADGVESDVPTQGIDPDLSTDEEA